jgi:mannonate dehydratase
MEKTWRWFGKKDKITLDMLRQIGVEGIVTALHDIPNGEIWTEEAINDLKDYIKSYGLRWSVVESLPVSEAIKYAGTEREHLIENYKISLANLGKCGIKTVCYNFMPVLDWARTDLEKRHADGTTSLFFDRIRFGYFDCRILNRKNAEADYSEEELKQIEELSSHITEKEKQQLIENIIVKTQGFVNGNITEEDKNPVALFKELLTLYDGIDRKILLANMIYFLNAIMPVCDKYGINMCVHPDDPPCQLLGLPRIVTCGEDIENFLKAVDNPHNGLTFCAGSLSAGKQNDIPALAKKFAPRTHFIHLRSTQVFDNGNFIEASHLEGRANLIEVVRIFEKQNPALPMRIDHGRNMLDDAKNGYNPGYSLYGRMFALAQIDGVMSVVDNELGINRKDYLAK